MAAKELTQATNRLRFRIQMWVLVGTLVATFLIVASSQMYFSHRPVTPQDLAGFGRWSFVVGLMLLSIMVPLAVLVGGAGVVTAERVNRRLELLLVTPLGPGTIVAAKAISILARALMGILLGLPVFALLSVFGGVDRAMIMSGAAFLLSNIWLYGMLGLFASVFAKKTSTALACAGLMALLWNVAPLLYVLSILMIVPRDSLITLVSSTVSEAIYSLSPFYTFIFAFFEVRGSHLPIHVGANLLVGLLFFVASLLLFRRSARRMLAPSAKRLGFFERRREARRSAGRGRISIAHFFGGGIVSKELSSWRPRRALLSLAWFAIAFTGVGLVSIASDHWPELTSADDQMALLLVEEIGFLFLLASQASTRIVREKEGRTLQALLLTGLTGRRVFFAKAAAILIEQGPGILFIMAHIFALFLLGLVPFWFAGMLGLLFCLAAVFSIMLGFYYSLAARKTTSAVVLTVATWAFGPFMAALVLVMFSGFGLYDRRMWVTICVGFPAMLWLCLMVCFYRARRGGFGVLLPAATWILLLQGLFLLNAVMPSGIGVWEAGGEDIVGASWLLVPGVASVLPMDFHDNGFLFIVVAMQVVLAAWMIFLCLFSYESQARRAS